MVTYGYIWHRIKHPEIHRPFKVGMGLFLYKILEHTWEKILPTEWEVIDTYDIKGRHGLRGLVGRHQFRERSQQVENHFTKHINRLVQGRRISSALAMKLSLSCTNLSKYNVKSRTQYEQISNYIRRLGYYHLHFYENTVVHWSYQFVSQGGLFCAQKYITTVSVRYCCWDIISANLFWIYVPNVQKHVYATHTFCCSFI